MTNPLSDVLERLDDFTTCGCTQDDWERLLPDVLATIERLSAELERLCAKALDDDHKRGCEGRQYHCTCEYDNELWLTAEEARLAALSNTAEDTP